MNINYLVHNTLWVPGHFHLTVGTAFALTAMSVSYWLVPQITGKRLKHRTIAALQPFVWFVGMVLMSNAMHRAGLAGVPRRTAEPEFNIVSESFQGIIGGYTEMRWQIAIGGVLLTVSLALFIYVMATTWLGQRGGQLEVNGSIPEPLSGAEHSPRILDNLKLWLAIAVVLIVLAYTLPLAGMLSDGVFDPGSAPVPV
jgi:cytochrome c oxidase subunit 1